MNLNKIKSNSLNTKMSLLDHLKSLLAEEYNAYFQYMLVKDFIIGNESDAVKTLFVKNADDELNDHATLLMNRIHDLSHYSCPIPSVDAFNGLAQFKFMPIIELSVDSNLDINILAENKAIEHYTEVSEYCESIGDTETADMLRKITSDEVIHLNDLQEIQNSIDNEL